MTEFQSNSPFSQDPEQQAFSEHIKKKFLEQEKISQSPQTFRAKRALERALSNLAQEDIESAIQDIHDALDFI